LRSKYDFFTVVWLIFLYVWRLLVLLMTLKKIRDVFHVSLMLRYKKSHYHLLIS
jgi:hypothetical protein